MEGSHCRGETDEEESCEGGAEADERRLGLDFREVEGSHHEGDADEEESYEGDSEADERHFDLNF